MGIEQLGKDQQQLLAGTAAIPNTKKNTYLLNADMITIDMNSAMQSVFQYENDTDDPNYTPSPRHILSRALIENHKVFKSKKPHSCIALMFDNGKLAPELRKVMHKEERYAPATDKKIADYRADGRLAPAGTPYEKAVDGTYTHMLAKDGRIYQTIRRPYETEDEIEYILNEMDQNTQGVDWNRIYNSRATKEKLLTLFYDECFRLAGDFADKDKHSVIVWRDEDNPTVWPREKDITEHPDYVQDVYRSLCTCWYGEADERVIEAIRPVAMTKNVAVITGDKDMWAQCLGLGSAYIRTDFDCPAFSVLFTRSTTVNLNVRQLMRMYGCYDESRLEEEDAFYVDADIAAKAQKAKTKRQITPRVVGSGTPKYKFLPEFVTLETRSSAQLLCAAFLITSYGADYCRKTKLTYFGMTINGIAKLIQRLPLLHHSKFWMRSHGNTGFEFDITRFFIILQGVRTSKKHNNEVDLFVDMLCRLLYNVALFRGVGRTRHSYELSTGGGPDFEAIVNAVQQMESLISIKELPEKEQTVSTLLTMHARCVCIQDDGHVC